MARLQFRFFRWAWWKPGEFLCHLRHISICDACLGTLRFKFHNISFIENHNVQKRNYYFLILIVIITWLHHHESIYVLKIFYSSRSSWKMIHLDFFDGHTGQPRARNINNLIVTDKQKSNLILSTIAWSASWYPYHSIISVNSSWRLIF